MKLVVVRFPPRSAVLGRIKGDFHSERNSTVELNGFCLDTIFIVMDRSGCIIRNLISASALILRLAIMTSSVTQMAKKLINFTAACRIKTLP